MIRQHEILDAARRQGVMIGHDGAILPDLKELAEERPCRCKGTGRIPVFFGGVLIDVFDCPRGCA